MEEAFVSEMKTNGRFKILHPIPEVAAMMPKIEGKISFLPFINFLKEQLPFTSDIQAQLFRHLIKRFEAQPSLLQPIEDMSILSKNENLIELLTLALFPAVCNRDKNTFTLAAPNHFGVFSFSDSFKKLFLDEKEEHLQLPMDIPIDQIKEHFIASVYEIAFKKFYGIQLNNTNNLICSFTDQASGLIRYYQLRDDKRFIDVHLKGDLPEIKDCGVCLNTFRILDLPQLMNQIPLEKLSLEGFSILTAEDVTTIESVESIKKILLSHEAYSDHYLDDLKQAVRTLVGINDLSVGLMPFVKINNEFVLEEEFTSQSLIGKKLRATKEDSILYKMLIGFLCEHPEPMAIAQLTEDLVEQAPFLGGMMAEGVSSYIVYPMQNSDGLLGLLELGSRVPLQLNFEVLTRLEPIIPLLSLAMLKNKEQFTSKIEQLIKEHFTALQPSVQWKFEEVAWDYLKVVKANKYDKSGVTTGNVIFENVHPIYGAIDIRNSSIERNHAIQKDLKEQLLLIDETLDKLNSIIQLPLLEGLKFKNQFFLQEIEDVLLAEDEVKINEFLETEVESVFHHLQKNEQVQSVIENYFSLLHDGHLYHFRREYEETLSQINDAVIGYLEQEETNTQQSYPHYFEKYRTDGVEYNIYLGQSLAPKRPFDPLYLKNLRLWQLKSMAEIAKITHQLMSSLKVPLQTTQLILIHSQPIAISFRKDERRFDVEGSYNIRYEIMKKRIDKVQIKDTNERLTQPGKIALVYFNQKETEEYQQYISFLQSKQILKQGIEFLDLEELQGVKGLKAMRVDINLEG